MNTNQNGIYAADAYYRLSKEDGDKVESDSIVNQKALVREFLKTHPDIQIHNEKVDDGYSGVNFERPAFQEMLEDIKSGKVNCVIVKDLSRFGRNYIEAGRYIEKIFPYLGVRFIAINDHIDTASDMSASEEMLIPFKNLINDAYCRDISIKVRSHLDIKRKNGQFVSSFAPYGYKKSSENKNHLVVDEKAAAVVRQIFQWKIEGMSGSRIADKLNALGIPTPLEYKHMNGENLQCGFQKKADLSWMANGVNRILKNEIYTGVLIQGKTSTPNYKVRKRTKKAEKDWIRCEDSHKAIISKEDFQLVKESFAADTRVAPEEQTLHLFSGFVKCGWCGGNMTRKTVPVKGKKYVYLVCVENKHKNGCLNNKAISMKKFEKTVLKVINLHIENILELDQMMKIVKRIPYSGYLSEKLQGMILDKEAQIQKKSQYIRDLYEDYKERIIDEEEYLELKEAFRTGILILEKEVEELKDEVRGLAEEKKSRMHWMEQFLQHRGFQELSRELLLRLVEEIRVYDKNRIEIRFRFQSEYESMCQYVESAGDYIEGEKENGTKEQEESV